MCKQAISTIIAQPGCFTRKLPSRGASEHTRGSVRWAIARRSGDPRPSAHSTSRSATVCCQSFRDWVQLRFSPTTKHQCSPSCWRRTARAPDGASGRDGPTTSPARLSQQLEVKRNVYKSIASDERFTASNWYEMDMRGRRREREREREMRSGLGNCFNLLRN